MKRSESGKIYAKKLANFVEKRLKNEKAASVSIADYYNMFEFGCIGNLDQAVPYLVDLESEIFLY